MDVARRTLHLWANGRPIGAANEERLSRLLATIRVVNRGTARANRSAIMTPAGASEELPLDLLAQARFDEFIAVVGRGAGRASGSAVSISQAARATRRPPPPVMLLAANQAPIETEPMQPYRGKPLLILKRSL